jgi:hypothetical protein
LQTFENGGSSELDSSVYSSDEIIEVLAQLQALSSGHGNIDYDSSGLHMQLSDMLAASAGILKQLSDTDKNRLFVRCQKITPSSNPKKIVIAGGYLQSTNG